MVEGGAGRWWEKQEEGAERRLIPRSERSGELLVKGGSPVLKKEEFAGRGGSYQEALPVRSLTLRLETCGRRHRDGSSKIVEGMGAVFSAMQ